MAFYRRSQGVYLRLYGSLVTFKGCYYDLTGCVALIQGTLLFTRYRYFKAYEFRLFNSLLSCFYLKPEVLIKYLSTYSYSRNKVVQVLTNNYFRMIHTTFYRSCEWIHERLLFYIGTYDHLSNHSLPFRFYFVVFLKLNDLNNWENIFFLNVTKIKNWKYNVYKFYTFKTWISYLYVQKCTDSL